MKTTIEENYKKLFSLGFKKRWLDDKSGFWLEKNININEFKGKLYYDGIFALIEIEIYSDAFFKKRTFEIIWKGSFKQLLIKNKKYGKSKN